MAIDLNRIAEKLKRQKTVAVTRDGHIVDYNPVVQIDSEQERNNQEVPVYSTLEPKRFAIS